MPSLAYALWCYASLNCHIIVEVENCDRFFSRKAMKALEVIVKCTKCVIIVTKLSENVWCVPVKKRLSSQGQAPTIQIECSKCAIWSLLFARVHVCMSACVCVFLESKTNTQNSRNKLKSRVMSIPFNIFMCHILFTLVLVLLVLSVLHLNNCCHFFLKHPQNCCWRCLIADAKSHFKLQREKTKQFMSAVITIKIPYPSNYMIYWV